MQTTEFKETLQSRKSANSMDFDPASQGSAHKARASQAKASYPKNENAPHKVVGSFPDDGIRSATIG
jgi:hypothetical protein